METKKIVISFFIVVFLIVLINVFSTTNQERYTARVIGDCYDSDNGVDADVGGTLVGSYNPTKAIKDFCMNRTTLGEYYCDVKKSNGKLRVIDCEFGCVIENGLGRCAEAPIVVVKCGEGCDYNGVCVPVGVRIDGKYCNWNGNLELEKIGNCENSYECESNLCVSKKCITAEQWGNFLRDIEKTYWWE